MEIMKLKRLRAPIPRQKPLIRRGLSSGRKRSSHRRTSNSLAGQEMCDNEVNNAVIIDMQLSNCRSFRVAEMLEYQDIGDMNVQCPKCGAMVWNRETVGKTTDENPPEVSICCMKGNIILSYMIQPPTLIENLFSGADNRSSNFISNLRCYNNMFAFTSFGGRVESRENDGRGPPNFVISGQNFHRIGSLLPKEGDRPKFAQLYIYDTENEVQNRLSHFSDEAGSNDLDASLVQDLVKMMDEHNILVKSFRMVRDFCQQNQNVPVKLRLFRQRNFDPRTYNVPHVGEVAALIVGDFDSTDEGRDIVVRECGGNLQRIHETHAKYIPLQYPLLFPHGEDQYDEKLKRIVSTSTRSSKKRASLPTVCC
ncbi:DNA helicase [Trifolium repens]|nr:DNA helicase [Trifolium repens]